MRKRRWLSGTPVALLFFAGTLLSDQTGVGIATALAALLHECGHLLAAGWMRIPLRSLRLDLLGARIEVGERMLSYGEEWLLAAAGPLFSLLGSIAAAPLWQTAAFFRIFSAASLLLGVLNLLPVGSFDGGRMAEAMLCRVVGADATYRVMSVLTFVSLFLLWMLSVYLLLRAGGGLSLLCFSVSLFARFLEKGKIA